MDNSTYKVSSDLLKDIFLSIYIKDGVLRNHIKAGETKQTLNSIYIAQDLLKEIFLRLPLRSLVRFKSVSKEWRSILESKSFIDTHLDFQKSGKTRRKILVGHNCDLRNLSTVSGLDGDEEIMYLQCDTSRPWMSCDGLVCMPEPGWVNVLNPSTGELRSFPSGPDPVPSAFFSRHTLSRGQGFTYFPGYWAMGFGRDKVTGSYKVVRTCFNPVKCDVLAVETGEWRRLRPPPYEIDPGKRSACVNGSIYWLGIGMHCKIVAFDLQTEEFRVDANALPLRYSYTPDIEILNLDDRLAISMTRKDAKELVVWCMDSKQERWSKTYSISLAHVAADRSWWKDWWFTPVMVSEEGNVLICDESKTLFKHYPHAKLTRGLLSTTFCVISPYLESLVRLKI